MTSETPRQAVILMSRTITLVPRHDPAGRPSAGLHGAAGTHERGVLDLHLEEATTAPATARRRCRPLLESWGLDDDQVYDLLLVVSELVTNAITHALPPFALHLVLDPAGGHVRVHVSDGGPRPASRSWAATRPESEHGRGTALIDALADRAGITDAADGTIDHWADLPLA
ncbi:ATP-binding protein [Streptomyces sp. NPDC048514]|uniref:ATP-binding protein n=1 Tax=Streptomyces sp. NPDC048514 TaxID=3365564 RepID=UPI003723AF34